MQGVTNRGDCVGGGATSFLPAGVAGNRQAFRDRRGDRRKGPGSRLHGIRRAVRFLATTALVAAAAGAARADDLIVEGPGTVTIPPGSIDGQLIVGASEDGSAEVGDLVVVNGAVIGRDPGVQGSVLVPGGGQLWISGDGEVFDVGRDGAGYLTIEDFGILAATSGSNIIANIGAGDGSHGAVYVHNGGTWSLYDDGNDDYGDINISRGSNSTGLLEIIDGLVEAGEISVGLGEGAEGTITISSDGLLDVYENTYIGRAAGSHGLVEITDGGEFDGVDFYIGHEAGSEGRVHISGLASQWYSNDVYVGNNGQGLVVIENKSFVNVKNSLFVGEQAGSHGEVSVASGALLMIDHGDRFSDDPTVIGGAGSGALIVDSGGAVYNYWDLIVGRDEGASGHVIVKGRPTVNDWWEDWDITLPGPIDYTLTVVRYLTVGDEGTGLLEISEEGTVLTHGVTIGGEQGGQGIVTVSGAGSLWRNDEGHFRVGGEGEGYLTVEEGARVEHLDTDVNVDIGWGNDSRGEGHVTGAGSIWHIVSNLAIGTNAGSQGFLDITDGGRVTVEGNGYVGYLQGSSEGYVTVSGAGSDWEIGDSLYAGWNGNGSVTITDNGQVEVGRYTDRSDTEHTGDGLVYIGANAGSTGHIEVSGGASLIVFGTGGNSNSGALDVGRGGTGTLTIGSGGRVENVISSIGFGADATGFVTVTGAGSTWTVSNSLYVSWSGTGYLTVADNGAVNVANSLDVGRNGAGTLLVQSGGTVTSRVTSIGFSGSAESHAFVTGPGSSWTVQDDLYVGYNGNGRLVIADSGRVTVNNEDGDNDIVVIANNGGSTGILAIGALLEEAPAAAGFLDAEAVRFGGGDGRLVFNHLTPDYEFAVDVSGDGVIEHHAGVTSFTGDGSGFTGVTEVHGGTLFINGTLGGGAFIHDGGRLGGTGSIGSGGFTVVEAGGAIAPGTLSTIGTFTVDGTVSFLPGSRFEVRIDGASHDRLEVEAAELEGGTVHAFATGASPIIGMDYVILDAEESVSGEFDPEVVSNFVFLDPQLRHDPTEVVLVFNRNSIGFCDVARTQNQCETGSAVEELGSGNGLFDIIVGLDEDGARRAFDSLSGEIHASGVSALIQDSAHVRAAMNDWLRFGFAESDGTTAILDEVASTETVVPAVIEDALGITVWARAFGQWGGLDGDGNAAAVDTRTAGLLLGLDRRVDDAVRLGVLAGYSHLDFDVDDRASTGVANRYHLGVYGGGQWGELGIRAGAAYTWSDVSTERNIAVGMLTDELDADYRAHGFQAFGEVGYRLATGSGMLEPFANLAYVRLDLEGYAEEGGDAALEGDGSSNEVAFTTLGVHAALELGGDAMPVRLEGTLGWRHAYGDTVPEVAHSFADSEDFTIAGAPIAEDAAVIEAGLRVALAANATLGIAYQSQMADEASLHGVRGDLRISF